MITFNKKNKHFVGGTFETEMKKILNIFPESLNRYVTKAF